MYTVIFHDVDEFLKELEKDAKRVERSIVRMTSRYKSVMNLPISTLEVVAYYVLDGSLVSLTAYCGDIWRHERTDRPALDKRDSLYKKIEEKCQQLRLEVRAGSIEAQNVVENKI